MTDDEVFGLVSQIRENLSVLRRVRCEREGKHRKASMNDFESGMVAGLDDARDIVLGVYEAVKGGKPFSLETYIPREIEH